MHFDGFLTYDFKGKSQFFSKFAPLFLSLRYIFTAENTEKKSRTKFIENERSAKKYNYGRDS